MDDYFYLDADNKPQGPHDLETLRTMVAEGKLSPKTLVARKGDSAWAPIGAPGAPAPEAPVETEWHCPKCGAPLTLTEDGQLPATCPTCGYRLRPDYPGFWTWGVMAIRKMFTFKGRATRKEYWVGCLLCYLLLIAGVVAAGVVVAFALHTDSKVTALIALLAIPVFLLLGWCGLTVTVRRLHDRGYSGWWLGLYMLISLTCSVCQFGSVIPHAVAADRNVAVSVTDPEDADEAMVAAVEQAIDTEDEATNDEEMTESKDFGTLLREEYGRQRAMRSMFPTWVILLSYVNQLAGLLLFVMTLLDSSRGNNAYGPSSKYPRG